jgi:hypothetical protein
MKQLAFLVAFLLTGLAVQAQTPPLPSEAATTTKPVIPVDSGAVLLYNNWYLPSYHPKGAEADTTGALLSMFRKKRYAGWVYVLPFMAGTMLALPVEHTDEYGNRSVADEAVSPPLGAAVLAGTVAGFIVHATMFNKAHLKAVDDAYATGKPIPAKYRSRLNANHFAEAAYLREAIRQQQEREQMQRPAQKTNNGSE